MNFYDILPNVGLFHGIDRAELPSMLECLQPQTVKYQKGEFLLMAGDKPETIGVVLSGALHIIREDVDGNRTLLATLTQADIYAEALCCAEVAESPVSVVADTDASVLQLHFARVLKTCSNSCAHHQKLIANMLKIVAQKNLHLQNRVELIRTKSVRAKVLGYLSYFAQARGTSFIVPLNRQAMADFLCVERSALSHELMRMKRDGLLSYHKNEFTLL